jgi:hypothetical protein
MPPPPSPLPPPLRGADPDPFTRASVLVRLPAILGETADSNPTLTPAARAGLLALRDSIAANGPVTPLTIPQPPGHEGWEGEYTRAYAGLPVLDVPWFFLENYAYRRVLDVLRADHPALDPFAAQKEQALRAAGPAFATTVLPVAAAAAAAATTAGGRPNVRAALYRSLWGNRADLSLTAGKVLVEGGDAASSTSSTSPTAGSAHDPAHLLADDSAAVEALLLAPAAPSAGPREVVILLDNCGLELLSDLVLVDTLLLPLLAPLAPLADRVTLLCKAAPVFVSDALPYDVEDHLAWLERPGDADGGDGRRAVGARLRAHQAAGRLNVESHPFLTSPLPAWEMPDDLASRLGGASLAVVKGDANYRRLVGDLHWPHETPFAAVTRDFPCPLVALRTSKAGVIVGLAPDAEARAAAAHPGDWLVSGTYGLVQLKA